MDLLPFVYGAICVAVLPMLCFYIGTKLAND